MNVYLSNPERKKERTDASANDKEIYVAGLSKYTNRVDLEKLFKTVSATLTLTALRTHTQRVVRKSEGSAISNRSGWEIQRLRFRRVRRRGELKHISCHSQISYIEVYRKMLWLL